MKVNHVMPDLPDTATCPVGSSQNEKGNGEFAALLSKNLEDEPATGTGVKAGDKEAEYYRETCKQKETEGCGENSGNEQLSAELLPCAEPSREKTVPEKQLAESEANLPVPAAEAPGKEQALNISSGSGVKKGSFTAGPRAEVADSGNPAPPPASDPEINEKQVQKTGLKTGEANERGQPDTKVSPRFNAGLKTGSSPKAVISGEVIAAEKPSQQAGQENGNPKAEVWPAGIDRAGKEQVYAGKELKAVPAGDQAEKISSADRKSADQLPDRFTGQQQRVGESAVESRPVKDGTAVKGGEFRPAAVEQAVSGRAEKASPLTAGGAETKRTFPQKGVTAAEQNPVSQQSAVRGDEILQGSRVQQPLQPQSSGLRGNVMQQLESRLVYLRETGSYPAEMRLTINPPELGEVTIRVFSRQGRLSASIIAETQLVREILEGSMTELRQRLNAVNISFDQLDLSASGKGYDDSDRPGEERGDRVSESGRMKDPGPNGKETGPLTNQVPHDKTAGRINCLA